VVTDILRVNGRNFTPAGLGSVENQDSPRRLGVIQAFDG
jgi:hypothetical protein